MARPMRRTAEIGHTALAIEGGLIAPTQVAEITARPPPAADYGAPKGVTLRDEISRFFRIGQAHWQTWSRIERPTRTQTAAFVRDLLRQAFSYDDLSAPVTHEAGAHRYHFATEARGGRVPIVVAAPVEDGDAFTRALPEFGDGAEGTQARRTPVALLQDWLNASDDALWGLVFAGDRVRLMRDNASFTRPAWIEADLGAMFRDEMIADFTATWLLLHASRFGSAGAPPVDCALERWREAGQRSGTRAQGALRANVEEALLQLGQGLLDGNPELRQRLVDGTLPMPALFEQLLRLVYRLIFLAVAEDRELLHAQRGSPAARLYADSYGFAYLRERSARRSAHDHHGDAWEGAKIVLAALGRGEPLLALPALGGLFAPGTTPDLDGATMENRHFLSAVFRLSWLIENSRRTRINWRDMATEELGSVYEGLLELIPVLDDHGRRFAFAGGAEMRGNARKVSGSYYTPDALVQELLNTALDPVLDRAEAEGGAEAILDLTVIDPACGSAHFLLGAARRMALRVARSRDPDAPELQEAMRDVVRRCIHGVDRNPMAVELAKVALWIESVAPGKPLGFLDANIRCGDALLGVFNMDALNEGIPDDAYKPLTGDDKDTAFWFRKRNKAEREGQASFDWERGRGGDLPPARLAREDDEFHHMTEEALTDVKRREERFRRREQDIYAKKVACDLYVAAFLMPKTGGVPESPARANIPTTAAIRTRLAGGNLFGPQEAAAVDVAEAARAFHWPLMFPAAMRAGGFDVVLGNPPWERIKLQEQEFFAHRAPEIANASNAAARGEMIAALDAASEGSPEWRLAHAFRLAKRIAEASSLFFTAPKNEDPIKGVTPSPARRYPWAGRGDVNTYALFAELFLNLTRLSGRSGIIVPTGIATDATTAPFFGHLVSGQRLAQLLDFENSAPIFPSVHRSYKFSLLTLASGGESADFAFFLTDVSQLTDARRRFTLTAGEIARINPNTQTAPIFRAQADARLTAEIYGRVPVLVEESKGAGGNRWSFDYMTKMFDLADSSDQFRTAEQLRKQGLVRIGTDWIVEVGQRPAQTAMNLAGERDAAHLNLSILKVSSGDRWVPLYQAKMMHHFDHRWATYEGTDVRDTTLSEKMDPDFEVTPQYWLLESSVDARLATKNWTHSWLIGWRDICRATDERTAIAAIYPRVAIAHSIRNLFVGETPEHAAAFYGNLVALAFDFVVRQQVGGTHLTVETLKQLPVLPPHAYDAAALDFIVPRVLELTYTSHAMAPFARDLGYSGGPFPWDEGRRASLRAELDAWYALAYGLTRDQLRYVLDPKEVMGADYPSETFRVLQSNEHKRFGEYRTARLVLDAYDQLLVSPPDTSELPPSVWQHVVADALDARLALAAVIKRIPYPLPQADVLLAALFVIKPHLLLAILPADRQAEWRRLVGNSADASAASSVAAFSGANPSALASAKSTLMARGELRYDAAADLLDRTSGIYAYAPTPWADGRAGFVLHAMRGMMTSNVLTALPQIEGEELHRARAA